MERVSVKLASFIIFVAIGSCIVAPFTAEARSKKGCHTKSTPPTPTPTPAPASTPTPAGIPPYQIHGCGYPCNDSNDCDAPCTICCANQTCCYDEPFVLPPSPPPPVLSPAPVPYQIHGCGYPCSDSNDCDWPCTICCANQTCCYDVPFDLSPPPPPPPSPPPVLSPAPVPYQIHGCGYPCSDSNDCDWPCTYCCWQNQTCCYEPSFDK